MACIPGRRNSGSVRSDPRARIPQPGPASAVRSWAVCPDHAIFDAAVTPEPGDDEALYRAAAAGDIINWRRGVLADLESQGVLSLDVFPEQMTAPLVNRYLEIKARHLL